MNIEILQYPTENDWLDVKKLALGTEWRKTDGIAPPTEKWKRKILDSGHSPIRRLMFTIRMEIPYCNSVHFVRHKIGVEHFVTSQRNDRQVMYDRNAARQDAPVIHTMVINADALINMSHRRLCLKADKETVHIMREICKEVIKVAPEFDRVLCPMCVYRGGVCHEMKPCGLRGEADVSARND